MVEACWSGYPVFFFNLAITARPPASIEEFADEVNAMCAWAAQRRAPWMFAVGHETMGSLLPGTERCLDGLGLVPMMPLTGMEAGELAPPARARPAGTWLTEADGSIGGKILRLNEAAYQTVLAEPGSTALEAPDWWRAPQRMATLVAPDGLPASCAAVFGVDGLRYVAFVATRPDAQRNGYADAAMRDVLARSREAGLQRRIYLHATAAGRPVYERMGFSVTAEYTVYVRREFLAEGH